MTEAFNARVEESQEYGDHIRISTSGRNTSYGAGDCTGIAWGNVMLAIETHLQSLDICACCENPYRWSYSKENKGNCFTCQFFLDFMVEKSRNYVIRNHGYTVGPQQPPGQMSGFGGSPFQIKPFSGESFRTTNLWHRGEIPFHMREMIPNTAEWDR